MAMTSCPAAVSAGQSRRPTKPDAPATSTLTVSSGGVHPFVRHLPRHVTSSLFPIYPSQPP